MAKKTIANPINLLIVFSDFFNNLWEKLY